MKSDGDLKQERVVGDKLDVELFPNKNSNPNCNFTTTKTYWAAIRFDVVDEDDDGLRVSSFSLFSFVARLARKLDKYLAWWTSIALNAMSANGRLPLNQNTNMNNFKKFLIDLRQTSRQIDVNWHRKQCRAQSQEKMQQIWQAQHFSAFAIDKQDWEKRIKLKTLKIVHICALI